MIGTLFLASALAARPAPVSWGHSEKEAIDVWLKPGVRTFDLWPRDGCQVKDVARAPLPEALRGRAYVVYAEACGEEWLIVRLKAAIGADKPIDVLFVRKEDVWTEPPARDPWPERPAVGTLYVRGPSDKPTWGLPVGPNADAGLHPFSTGEALAVLDADNLIVRDVNGRTYAAPAFAVVTEEPYRWISDPDDKALRQRFVTGKARAEQPAGIAPVPSAESLAMDAAAMLGRTWHLELSPKWITADRRFEAGWLDPTGQVLDHTCDRHDWGDVPCGRYWLDYSAFGAWWPTRSLDVLAVSDGVIERGGERLPVLKIVVKSPWNGSLAVSPAWDGVDPGAIAPVGSP